MDRYLVQHRHRPDVCPAGNPEMAAMPAGHLSPENGERYGVRVLADCVHPGEHILNVIVEADDAQNVNGFFAPFMQVGSVSIKPVITCKVVAARAQD